MSYYCITPDVNILGTTHVKLETSIIQGDEMSKSRFLVSYFNINSVSF